jgi:hypothetical protein
MTAAPRLRLPNRRMQFTDAVEWQGHTWMVSAGFAPDGRVLEAFVKGIKTGSSMDAIMDDACVLLSLLLQAGYPAQALAEHLGREGVDPTAPAASPLGLIAITCAAMEAGVGASIAQAQALMVPAGSAAP